MTAPRPRFPVAAGVFLVALLASPVLAIYEVLLGTLAAALGLAASVALPRRGLRQVAVVGMAVALAGLVYIAAGLLLSAAGVVAPGSGSG